MYPRLDWTAQHDCSPCLWWPCGPGWTLFLASKCWLWGPSKTLPLGFRAGAFGFLPLLLRQQRIANPRLDAQGAHSFACDPSAQNDHGAIACLAACRAGTEATWACNPDCAARLRSARCWFSRVSSLRRDRTPAHSGWEAVLGFITTHNLWNISGHLAGTARLWLDPLPETISATLADKLAAP